MKVLLLHHEDGLSAMGTGQKWDLVVDLGRAPATIYERWSKQAGCDVVSLYDFAGFEDLHGVRQLLQLGMGQIVDDSGIDWWDVVSLMVESELRQIMLMGRLARRLEPGCELFASRSTSIAAGLQVLSGAKAVKQGRGFRPVFHWAAHYRDVFSQLDVAQIKQAVQDRFDRQHVVRRRFAGKRHSSRHPVVLLPSAYINVSRTAVSYASLLPQGKFLLVYARNSARLKSLPLNVSAASLDPYFKIADAKEASSLASAWKSLKTRLISSTPEFSAANATGLLDQVPGLMRWGIAVRDAWNQVFQSEDVAGLLCADDSNPYTRIPLILARNRGIPTVACHHGALDSKMALKIPHADVYLAKGEIESDYLIRRCGVDANKVVLGGRGLQSALELGRPPSLRSAERGTEPWLVFFTEPYAAAGWRTELVYAELLPGLWSLAESSGLKLVFKLHPFESVRGHRRILRKYLPQQESQVGIMAGAPSPQLWRNTRFALTVQSTVALHCVALGIPVFLCSWLKDTTAGYVEQFSKFGIGHTLESVGELREIPRLLELHRKTVPLRPALWESVDPAKLRKLLFRTISFSEALKA
jgi:hypothetical protein